MAPRNKKLDPSNRKKSPDDAEVTSPDRDEENEWTHELSFVQFDKLCEIQCTKFEITSWFDISNQELEKWCMKHFKMPFLEIARIKRKAGYVSLRRAQFRMAQKIPTMAIWLGKQWLGQRDVVRTEFVENPDDTITDEDIPDIDFNDFTIEQLETISKLLDHLGNESESKKNIDKLRKNGTETNNKKIAASKSLEGSEKVSLKKEF